MIPEAPPPADPPPPKAPPPPLTLRAPRPVAVRLRGQVIVGIGLTLAGVAGGALAWALAVQPNLRALSRARAADQRTLPSPAAAKPSPIITAQPASYDRLAPPPGARPEPGRPAPAAGPGGPQGTRSEARPHAVDLAAPARGSGLFFAALAPSRAPERLDRSPEPAAEALTPHPSAPTPGPQGRLTAPPSPFTVEAGAILPAALLTAVDTARAGPVVASLTEDVFDSVSGKVLLAPQGSRLIGRHDGASKYGDRRAFLTWSRLILPNGKSLVLDSEPGVDAEGAVGVPGQAARRIRPLAFATLAAGAITALGQAARDHDGRGGLLADAGDAAAIDAARVGGRLVEREMDVTPSIRLQAGVRVRVLLTHDLVLEPYRP